jgi:type III pantothenate kinase
MPSGTILAIDVGNSRIKFGLFAGDVVENERPQLAEALEILAVPHADPIPWETIGGWLADSHGGLAQALLAGVKPAGIERLLAEWPSGAWPRPRVIRKRAELPLEVRVDAPDGVGIDRLLGAVAVNGIRLPGQPAIVVGSGTATTVDLIAGDGAFEGGAILPGLELGSRSLHQYTALLPLVPVEELADPTLPAIGKNTPAAIRSGLLYGQVGAVKEIIARLSSALTAAGRSRLSNSGVQPLIVVTGGNGPLLAAHLGKGIREERELPLRGLALISRSSHCRSTAEGKF